MCDTGTDLNFFLNLRLQKSNMTPMRKKTAVQRTTTTKFGNYKDHKPSKHLRRSSFVQKSSETSGN